MSVIMMQQSKSAFEQSNFCWKKVLELGKMIDFKTADE